MGGWIPKWSNGADCKSAGLAPSEVRSLLHPPILLDSRDCSAIGGSGSAGKSAGLAPSEVRSLLHPPNLLKIFIFKNVFRELNVKNQRRCVLGTFTEKLKTATYSVHHNPNCPSPFQVRLVGRKAWRLDNLPPGKTQDIIGHGTSMEEAAKDVWLKKHQKP